MFSLFQHQKNLTACCCVDSPTHCHPKVHGLDSLSLECGSIFGLTGRKLVFGVIITHLDGGVCPVDRVNI